MQATIDYSDYTVRISKEPEYYGPECTQEDADAIAERIAAMIHNEFPGIVTETWADGHWASAKTTGPHEEVVDAINTWISENWELGLLFF